MGPFWFRQTRPDYNIDRESGKPNGEERQGTHHTSATLLRPAIAGGIDSVHRGTRDEKSSSRR